MFYTGGETSVPVRVLIVNEKNSHFGRGWTLAGLQQVHVQADSFVTVTDGSGSIAYFKKSGSGFYTPPGDFSTLTQLASGRYERSYADGTKVTFTSTGLQDSVVDRLGNATRYTYDAQNPDRLKEIIDPVGKKITFTYGVSYISSIRGPGSPARTSTFTLAPGGKITDITDPDGVRAMHIRYHGTGFAVKTVTDRGGADHTAIYDGFGRLRADSLPAVLAGGQNVRPFVRTESPEIVVIPSIASGKGTSSNPGTPVPATSAKPWVKDALGNQTFFLLDRFGAPTRIEEPLGRTTELTRNWNSQVTQVVTPSPEQILRATQALGHL